MTATHPHRPLHGRRTAPATAHPRTSARLMAIAIHAALGGALLTGIAPAPAAAQEAPAQRQYTIAAGPLGNVLAEYAASSGVQLVFDPAALQGLNSPGLNGRFAVREGFDLLLAGSGWQAVPRSGNAWALQKSPVATLGTVTVTDSVPRHASGLPEAYAGGQVARGGRVGLLGNRDALDTPFSTTQYTAKLIEDQQAQNLGDVLVNDPSIRNTYSRGAGRDEFNIRGFTLFNYDVAYNGLYGISPRNSSTLIGIERVEVLRGPNALLNGMAPYGSVGGAINLVPKRAGTNPLNRLTLSYIDDGQLGAHFDIARRYGEQQEWGVRFNGMRRSGDLPMKGSKEKLNAFSLGIDYQGDRLRAELDVNQQDRLTHARSGLLFPAASGTRISSAPKGSSNFFPDWTYWDAKEQSISTRLEFDLNEDWTAFGALGYMRYDFSSLQANWLMLDDQGNIGARPTRLREDVDTLTGEVGLRGRFYTGSVKHEPVLSMSYFGLEQGQQRVNGAIVMSNIYNPVDLARPNLTLPSGTPKVRDIRLRSLALADTLSFNEGQVQLTLGLRHQQVVSDDFNGTTGARTSHYDRSAVTPSVGVVFKPTEQLSLYANYIEGLSLGPTPPTTADNSEERFPPIKTKQFEIGAKRDFGRFSTTVSAFQIELPSGLTVNDGAVSLFKVDGEQRNRGIELLFQGEVRHDVRLLAGATWTQAELVKTEDGTNDGKVAPAVPKLQFNLSGEWDTPFLPGATLTARLLHTGSQYVDASNTQKLPDWTRLDLGARYAFTAGDTPLTVRATVENVFNKNYWQSAAREGLTVGAPRTLLLSVSADF